MDMTLDDLAVCDLDGNVLEGTPGADLGEGAAPVGTAPARQHRRHDALHAKFATMFALTRQPIPAVIEEFDVFVGGDVDVAEYRTTGTDELADEVVSRVGEKAAVLMANHGLFAVGKNPKDVLHIAELVERTAEIIWGEGARATSCRSRPR